MKLKHESTLLYFLFPTALLTRGSRERFCKVNLYSLGKKGKGEGRKIKDHSMAMLVELWEGCTVNMHCSRILHPSHGTPRFPRYTGI